MTAQGTHSVKSGLDTPQRRGRRSSDLLSNAWLQLCLGIVVASLPPSLLAMMRGEFLFNSTYIFNSFAVAVVAVGVGVVSFRRINKFPDTSSVLFTIPIILIVFFFGFAFILVARIDYSRSQLLYGLFASMIYFAALAVLANRTRIYRLGVIPFGRAAALPWYHPRVETRAITAIDDPLRDCDGVVTDLHADIDPAWERYLARVALAGIPVYHYKQAQEALTGRIQIEHLSENPYGSLQPSHTYLLAKRVIDTAFTIIALIGLLPLLLLIAVLIRLDSPGPALFRQRRRGYRNKIFQIYKFRTMYCDTADGAHFTRAEDHRITRIGHVLRRYRLDELPQMINILRGEMSWIGPRPEAIELSNWYEREVPFFSYRHVVRPGISGWAQVSHGYAAEVDGATVKLEHDFFYIKNFSFWIDLVIVMKTFKIVLTGFGAR